jgi:hypothetical protein
VTTEDPGTPPYGQQPTYFPQPQQEPLYFRPQPGDYRGHYAPGQQYPPQQPPSGPQNFQPGPPLRKSHRTRNIVLGVLGVIVLGIIIGTATSGGGNGSPSNSTTSNPPAAANNAPAAANNAPAATSAPAAGPTTVTFNVTGNGNGGGVSINYGSDSDNISPSACTGGDLGDSCTVPWSASLAFDGSAQYYDINAQLGSEGGSISCSIVVTGPDIQPLTVASGQAAGPDQICNAQAAPTDSSGTSWEKE